MADNATDVFVYTGIGEGADVPKDVVRVRIDPSVLAIPEYAFANRSKMETIELHDGLREIGHHAFCNCKVLNEIHLSDAVERIGHGAFFGCNFTKVRSPPLVTRISIGMLDNCTGLFSLEFTESIIRVDQYACCHCYSLRNVALASDTTAGETAFQNCRDLLHIFGTEEAIVNALRNRFDGLPVHCKMYYISYYPVVLEEIRNLILSENGEVDPTGNQQDCLGMTPLHILACSTVQCLELYQFMVDKYPNNLIVEDDWGATPLLYAIWGDAPSEIVEFLVNSCQSLYPNHELDWNGMLITLGRANAPKRVMQNLIDVQQRLSPEYSIDWDQVLRNLAAETEYNIYPKTFCFLTRCSIVTRVNAIGVMHFRDAMADDWTGSDNNFNGQVWRAETLAKLEYYELEYRKLKESTSLLELALWKATIEYGKDHGEAIAGDNEEMNMDQSEFRLKSRISCGADHVVENVLPYLLPPDFVRSQRHQQQR
jgi:hypothetical protein